MSDALVPLISRIDNAGIVSEPIPIPIPIPIPDGQPDSFPMVAGAS